MSIEFIGMIHHRQASEIHPPGPVLFDRGYVRDFAQAAEAGGFDRVLVGYFSDGPDGFLLASLAAAHTERLSFLLAHRPGFVAPTLAARKFATLDQVTGGRAAIHVITGGDDTDQLRDGDTLPKDERYARTDEYLHILKRIWTETGRWTTRGNTIGSPAPRRRCAACSSRAFRSISAARRMRPSRSPASTPMSMRCGARRYEQVRELTARVRAAAAQHGREVRFSLSFRPILAATEDAAWARAEQIKQRIAELRAKAGLGAREPANEGSRGCWPPRRRASGWTSGYGPARRC